MTPSKTHLTSASGIPVVDKQNSLSAGPRGPLLLQDFRLIEKLQHFNRERIPERVVHAKGSGAYGTLTVTHDITGILELNRNPDNYHEHVEQAAFSPANIVPGMGYSPDKMLQGRLFAFHDAQLYRVGTTHQHLPVAQSSSITEEA